MSHHTTIYSNDRTLLADVMDMGGHIGLYVESPQMTPDEAYKVGTELLRMAARKRRAAREAKREAEQ